MGHRVHAVRNRHSTWIAISFAIGLAGLAAGCSTSDSILADRYPTKGDVKPHRGVDKARRLPIHGIDVSRWQGTIDWDAVRDAGTRFAFIKATEGGDHADPSFWENWQGAKRAGVLRGAYHFVFWCRPAREQALWFLMNVPPDPDALPPVLDLEWNGESDTCPRKIDPVIARGMVQELLTAMEAHTGKRPIIYTDITFHRDVLAGGHFGGYSFWLRSVADEPRNVYGDRPWTFWQFTTTGRVPGIRGNVDRNAFVGTAEQWEHFVGGGPVLANR
jgi:lysozyme